MLKTSLNGRWSVRQADRQDWIEATVPGSVHTDLLAAGRIPDPFFKTQELDVLWVGESDWIYAKTFTVEKSLLEHDHINLRFEGLDTLATIRLNGHLIATTDNMFRTWMFDVKDALQEGENNIEVRFDSAVTYGKARLAERHLANWGVGDEKLPGGNYVRKAQSHFGWDWGPRLVTCGIWRDVTLIAHNGGRLTDLEIRQTHQDGRVDLAVHVESDQLEEGFTAQVTLAQNVSIITEGRLALKNGRGLATFTLDNPELWWPNGLGEQPLYRISVDLFSESGERLDRMEKRIGLRTLNLVREPDEWGESFHFEVNGVPFFAKGGNWIPADTFVTRITEAKYRDLLTDIAAANMNMVRVWGGGIYEPDHFYDLCDELGLCVWQDFMFACAAYPVFDAAWMETVAAEARDNVKRLRHHASLALWCGNNELEQGLVGDEYTETTMSWADYARLFEHLLRDTVAELDPETDYWPGSPHSPLGDRTDFNNPRWGDAHLWSVWHGKEPFEWYRTCEHRFNSEFGFQSFPDPHTVATFTDPADRNITGRVMEHHQRSGIGNQTIIHYMLDWFKLPHSFDNILWLSQITQGMAMKYAVEHWRRSMPRGMGTLYWQLNDCWPVASWSSIDYDGRWKALHYMAKGFNAPLLLSGLEEMESGRLELHLTNDLTEAVEGQLVWEAMTATGEPIASGSESVTADALSNTLALKLDFSPILTQFKARNVLVTYRFERDGVILTSNLTLFCRPKQLELVRPTYQIDLAPLDDGRWQVTLTADQPALWVWIDDIQGVFKAADGFFHLRPGVAYSVAVAGGSGLTAEKIRARLRVLSLADLAV